MRACFIVVLVLSLIVSVSFVPASFTKGEISSEIETEYGADDFLRGWINISLQNEPVNSLLSCFDNEISILDFLEKAGDDYECSPDDCENYYKALGEGDSVKSFSLNKLETKIIGLKFQGELKSDPKINLSFKIESNAKESCFQPLKIDILNNKEINWLSFSVLDDFPCSFSTGCFDSSKTISEHRIRKTPYCEKIKVPPKPNFEIGAYIIKGTTSNPKFTMEAYDIDEGFLAKCILPTVNSSGEKSCIVSLNLTEVEDIFVCVNADKETDYEIKKETVEPCGFYGNPEDFEGDFTADYYIFARASKYAPLGSFIFNEEEFEEYNGESLEGYIENYLDRFDYNCTKGCTVPIKFISGINQQITLSNLQLSYDTTMDYEYEDKSYDVGEEDATINTNFIRLNLKYANFSVPLTDGEYDAEIYLNGGLVAEEEISVFASINITGLNSQEVPAAVPYKMVVYVSGENIISYTWDFGDGTIEETTENEITHTYSEIGEYSLKIEVTAEGKKAIKSFLIKVVSPKKFIELSLKIKKENLNNTKQQLEAIPTWYKKEIEKLAGLDEISSELERIERKYDAASISEEYVAIMSELTELEVPYSLQGHYSSGDFFLNAKYIDPSYLIELGAGEIKNPEKYTNSIISWFNDYIEMKAESNIYYLYYAVEPQPLLTSFIIKIKPKKDFLRESYFVIEKGYAEIIFKENYNEKAAGFATAIIFSELKQDEEKIIEFILPEKIEILELPVYISPEFSELPEINDTIAPCNSNGICEKDLEETGENCPSDCRPWKKILTYLAILLFVAFVVYIAMQEWYKRYYENRLFENKNDLFNLISFMNNALNQGFSRIEIIKKLEDLGWSGEQLIYAFKKREGERTGMWEIPIFKWVEKRKVEKEIAKRRQFGIPAPPKQSHKFRKF